MGSETYSFDALPAWIECAGDGFAPDCRLTVGPLAVAAGSAGRLRLRIWRHGRKQTIAGAELRIGLAAGNVQIALGDDGSAIEFEPGSSGAYDLRLWRNAIVRIGARTTSNGVRIVCDDSEFRCGEDCMFSDSILVQAGDQHGIVDISTKTIVNAGRRYIHLDEHVWLGRGCTLMSGVHVGRGAVIGTGALVTRSIEPMAIAVGIPARVIKRGFTWCRSPDLVDENVLGLIDAFNAGHPA